ncbi:MAG: hypothetical protein AAFN13_06385, partial [Bacteroidota bacterium]
VPNASYYENNSVCWDIDRVTVSQQSDQVWGWSDPNSNLTVSMRIENGRLVEEYVDDEGRVTVVATKSDLSAEDLLGIRPEC